MQDLIVLRFMALLSRQLDFFPFFSFLFFFPHPATDFLHKVFWGSFQVKVVKHWASFELESLKEWVVSFILMQVEI